MFKATKCKKVYDISNKRGLEEGKQIEEENVTHTKEMYDKRYYYFNSHNTYILKPAYDSLTPYSYKSSSSLSIPVFTG